MLDGAVESAAPRAGPVVRVGERVTSRHVEAGRRRAAGRALARLLRSGQGAGRDEHRCQREDGADPYRHYDVSWRTKVMPHASITTRSSNACPRCAARAKMRAFFFRGSARVDLKALVSNGAVGIAEIAAALDACSPDQRAEAALSLNRGEQRALYQKAGGSSPLGLADFVPSGRAPLDPVRHRGRNTLPMMRKLQLFEKRFCRPQDGTERLFGYNQSPFLGTIGPGFFVAVKTADNPTWEERGAVVVDYFQVPDGPVAEGWPKVIPNTQGLQKFVYNQTRDFMRRVSMQVTIGAAFKIEKSLDHYFMLVRQD